uniref:LysM peptidoglycan-binding domain-containing protein n=1 Tax=Burkholderia sp. GbtcB21 TaxID=2824766 RepID=UPI001C2F516C
VTTPVSVADFDENYMRIDGTYPGASPGTWTVREEETLKSIASALWGDETLWYVLADANGLKSTDELKAGQTLTVPNKVTNVHNTASTFKPYDPGQAIGDTQPTLPDPPPPPSRGGGCGGFLPVIAIVVAVVVSVVTYGTTSPYMASLAGSVGLTGGAASTAAAVGAGAVAGAAGSMASQGVMIAGGAQQRLDWNGVALGAMGGAIAGGVTSAMPAGSFGTAAAQGAVRSVATQGIGLATGLQDRFDWKGVAASAIASGVGYAANQAIGQLQYGDAWEGMAQSALRADRFNTAVRGVGTGMAAGAASTVVRGGSLGRNVGAITMDAIASTLGNMIIDQIASTPTSTDLRTQQAIAAMNGQILPGGVGAGGMGFVPADTSYIQFANTLQTGAAVLGNYDTAAGIEQMRAQRIVDLQLAASQQVDEGFGPGVHVLIEGVGSTDGPISQSLTELGTIRNLSWFESQLAFNPAAQAAQGIVDRGLEFVSGAWGIVSHPLNTAAAIGGHYADAYEASNLGGTIARDASGITAGVVKGVVGPIDALYRRDEAGAAYRLGGSLMDMALSAATPGAVGAATRLTGAALERGAAMFGPNLARMSENYLAKTGGLSYVVENGGVGTNYSAAIARIESEGHALARHGGSVTDNDLFIRATTGVAPDRSVVLDRRSGLAVVPPSSTAFNSDALLARADLIIREGYLDRAIAFVPPGADRVVVEGVNVGAATGRGFDRVSRVPGVSGPLRYGNGLSRATGVYEYDALSGLWKTITIYPVK